MHARGSEGDEEGSDEEEDLDLDGDLSLEQGAHLTKEMSSARTQRMNSSPLWKTVPSSS